MVELGKLIKEIFGEQGTLVLILICLFAAASYFFFWFVKQLIKSHTIDLNLKNEEIRGLQKKFLDFHDKMIKLLNRFDNSITTSQQNDMTNQQKIIELKEKVNTATQSLELKFEKLFIRIENIDKKD